MASTITWVGAVRPTAAGWWGCGLRTGASRTPRPAAGRAACARSWPRFEPELRLTPHRNVVLVNIADSSRVAVAALLARYGLDAGDGTLSSLRRYAMACPALPTCGLALAESERFLPDVIAELERRGYGQERVWIRMSGCPNSCSRPPTAEIGIIGRSLRLYTLYVGGSFEGLRLAQLFKDNVPTDALADELAALLDVWRADRHQGEGFGDFCHRVGPDALRERAGRGLAAVLAGPH